MSDVWFENSWQAADGKWYPLEAHPSHPSNQGAPASAVQHEQSPFGGPIAFAPTSGAPGVDQRTSNASPGGAGRLAVIGIAALVIGLALGAGAFALFGGSDDEASFDNVVEALVETGDPRNPLENGDEFSISVTGPIDDYDVAGVIHGAIEVPSSEFAGPGQCIAVLGELEVDAEAVLVEPQLFVSFALDDNLASAFGFDCDPGDLLSDGYVSLEQLAVVPGEPESNFSKHLAEQLPDHLGVGPFSDRGLFSYEYELIDEVPRASTGDEPDIEFVDSGEDVEFVDRFGDRFEARVFGYVEVQVFDFLDMSGRCFVVLVTYSPDDAISREYASPSFGWFRVGSDGAVSSGDSFNCDTIDVDRAGYRPEFELTPRAGTEVAVAWTVQTGGGEPEYAILGDIDGELIGVELEELDEIPDP